MKWQRPVKYSVLVVAALVVAAAGLSVQVCRDWAFVCENTGSRKGYRQWTLGPKTGHWYEKSPLEEFVESQQPDALVHRWTSYSGTGRNIFGQALLFGHGRPGAILGLDHDIQRRWIEENDTTTVRKLYDLLVSDDEAKIEERIMEIWEEVLDLEKQGN